MANRNKGYRGKNQIINTGISYDEYVKGFLDKAGNTSLGCPDCGTPVKCGRAILLVDGCVEGQFNCVNCGSYFRRIVKVAELQREFVKLTSQAEGCAVCVGS